jgi:uncharacterized membrane protein
LKRLKDILKKNLIAGLIVILPIALTFYIIMLLLRVVDHIFNYLPSKYNPGTYLPFPIPGLGFIIVFIIILITGFFARNYVGSKLIAFWEKVINKIPFVRSIYIAIKRLGETLFLKTEKNFKRVVLIEYPRKGIFTFGFTTGVGEGEIQEKTEKQVLNVFVPTTPNPTSGFYLLAPPEELIFLEMSVEDAFKLIMSAGIVTPERKK